MNADPTIKAEIAAVYEALIKCYQSRDMDGVLGLYCAEADPILIGTGADEVRVGIAQIRRQFERDFAQSEEMKWREKWFSASVSGQVAWVAAEGEWDVRMKERRVSLPMRLSIVLRFWEGRWRIVHSHASMPALDQEAGESFPRQG